MSKSTFVYVTYIRTSPDKLWSALTTPALMRDYWFGCTCESDWKKGSPWKLVLSDGRVGDAGEIVEADPPRRLVIKWRNEWKEELKSDGWSLCTMELSPVPDCSEVVQLTITHGNDVPGSKFVEAVSGGWPRILSNLKSLLETGSVVMNTKRAS